MIKINKYGTNENIKFNILTDEKMKEIRFNKIENGWYFVRSLKCSIDISFNCTIYIDDNEVDISIIDEDFGQHYDYQSLLKNDSTFEFGLKVKEEVEMLMKYLKENGIIYGHNYGEYI